MRLVGLVKQGKRAPKAAGAVVAQRGPSARAPVAGLPEMETER